MPARKASPKSPGLQQALTGVLLFPVAICLIVGVIFSLSDMTRGLTLIGVGLLMGVVNFLVVKVLFKRLEERDQGGPEAPSTKDVP